MAESRPAPTGRRPIVLAQLLLVVAAGAVWAASRLPWVVIRSFDGLGPPKEVTLSGASWSTALLPLALLMLATAVAALAVRGWPLRVLAVLLALASLAVGYLGVSLWVVPDVAVRGADLAHVSVVSLVGSERQYWGAGAAVAASLCTLVAAVLLLRSASIPGGLGSKYASPYASSDSRGALRADAETRQMREISERTIWDELDEGRDPTQWPREPDNEGR